jgi:hypothetical protein
MARDAQSGQEIRPESIRLITYLAKPWDELNEFLTQRFAFQPEISDVTRWAGALAAAIKHQAEISGFARKMVDAESLANPKLPPRQMT